MLSLIQCLSKLLHALTDQLARPPACLHPHAGHVVQDKAGARYWSSWLVKLQSKLIGRRKQGATPLLYCATCPELSGALRYAALCSAVLLRRAGGVACWVGLRAGNLVHAVWLP